MNTCPNCGKVTGLHSSILQGCMCQYSMQSTPQRTWVGLTQGTQHMNKYEQIKGMANPNRGSVGVQEAQPPQRTEQLKACVYCGQLVAKEKK